MDKTEAMTFNIERNHGLYDKAGKSAVTQQRMTSAYASV